ncbi:MAG: hypothetical protein K5872_17150 [Rhizobiaceae bacterium]|nr:hypothetical protein [Rhizobiaceae bacterium]MCV0407951.1 hypothetical protein [Rhizobiaceae bacterium]
MDVGCCPGIGAVLLEGGPRCVPALIDRGLSPNGHLARREIIVPCDQYSEQVEAFARSILDCEPLPYGSTTPPRRCACSTRYSSAKNRKLGFRITDI